MSLLHETFAAARAEGRAVLIGYLPAGFPTAADSVALIAAFHSSRRPVASSAGR